MTIFCYKNADTVECLDISKIAGVKLYDGVYERLSAKLGEDFSIVFEFNYDNDSFFGLHW